MIETSKHAPIAVGALLLITTCTVVAADSSPTTSTRPTLDLKAPPIARIFTPQQIDMILARTVDAELEHVEVEASRIEDLPFRDRSATVVEAAFPAVARWLTPYPTAIAARVNRAPDATDPARPAPLSVASYHPSFPPPYSQR